jgi:hypothetical protein
MIIRLAQSSDLEVHRVEDGCVVFIPATDQVHFLNDTAMFVFDLCDGTRTADDLRHEFVDVTGADFVSLDGILEQFAAAGLVASVPAGCE